MRTKTLVIAAAAIAAGVISSQAQSSNVYSANVVGYYNVRVPAGGYTFVANQLTNAANDVNSVLTNGLYSDVNGVLNTTLFKWNGNGYNIYQFFNGVDADTYFGLSGSTPGWYDTVGSMAVETLDQGSGSFLYNPASFAVTNTFVGEVVQGSFTIPMAVGFNTYSIVQPVSTNFDNAGMSFPGVSDVNGVNNDVLFKFNGNGYNIVQYFTGADADAYFGLSGSVNGFYDTVGTYLSQDPGYVPAVGEGFFIQRLAAGGNWTYSFTVK